MGLAFKEDCPDLRNSKSIELADKYSECVILYVMDSYVKENISNIYEISNDFFDAPYDAIVIPVRHKYFVKVQSELIQELLTPEGKVFDGLNTFPSVKAYSL